MTSLDAQRLRDELDSRGPSWLAARLGIRLRHGRARCPIHRGDSPDSFAVYEHDDGAIGWTCHSLCGSGDALALIARMNGLDTRRDFGRVLELAANLVGSTGCGDISARRSEIASNAGRIEVRPDSEACRVFEAFVEACPLGGDALDYLKWTRKCWSPADLFLPATRFGAGYFWPDSLEKTAEAIRLELTERYLPRASEWATHPLILPITDATGRVVALQGRSIDPKCDKRRRFVGRGPAKLGFFGGRDIAANPGAMVVLTEGAMDALILRYRYQTIAKSWGPHVAIGRAGASGGLSQAQAEQLRGRHVLIAFDGDDAGRKGGELAVEALRGIASKVERLVVPDGKDLSDVEVAS